VADSSAGLLGRYAFDPWGRRTLTTGSDVTSEGFTGHRWTANGSMLLAQYRAYDSELGRWLSEDPAAADGPNLYAYVRGNPVLWVDPDGLQRRRCTARVYAILRLAVITSCKAPTSCNSLDSCTVLKLKIVTKRMCIVAQTALTNACFPNDRTHTQRIEDEKRGIKRCQDILAEKEKNCQC
jgi:RHS repeat-associated protein